MLPILRVFCAVALVAVLSLASSGVVHAESTLSVEQVAKRAVLIVKCRMEIKGGVANYRVLESSKGQYSPDLFYLKPIEGYLYSHGFDVKGISGVKDGQEVVLIYSDNSVSGDPDNKGKIRAHSPDSTLPVEDEKIVWAHGEFESTVYKLDELKHAVLKVVKDSKPVPSSK